MAQAIIRALPLYYQGKKFAEVSSGTYDINSGDEAQFGTEGYMGHSDGATVSKIDADVVVPVPGITETVLADMLAKKYVQMGIFADGAFNQHTMRITHASYTWDSKTGAAKGKFTFEGGPPDQT